MKVSYKKLWKLLIDRDMKNTYNVGVDIIGFAPKTLDEIIKGVKK